MNAREAAERIVPCVMVWTNFGADTNWEEAERARLEKERQAEVDRAEQIIQAAIDEATRVSGARR